MHKTTIAILFVAPCLLATVTGCGGQAAAGPAAQREVALEIRKKLEAGSTEGGAAGEAAAPTGTAWGTLAGRFTFEGTPPAPGRLNVDKDTEVCGKGAGILDNSLVVSSDGGIANIVVYARAKRVHESAKPLEGKSDTPVVFDQKNCMFLSHVLPFQLGTSMDIKNSDPIGHNTKIDPQRGVPFNQTLAVGKDAPYMATAEETFPATVSCSIHPWMRAYILPRKDKYFAVTKDDGTFEIANLPAGEELELQVWHERGTGPGGGLALDRKDLKWTDKGRFKINLKPDETTQLDLKVPAGSFSSR